MVRKETLAYWERKTIKEVMDEALGSYPRERIKPVTGKIGGK